jgi:RimJ/RimL family protein N-acetyltransferase
MSASGVEIRGERVILRDPLPEDADASIRWATVETEWQNWDAPWEGFEVVPPERIEQSRASHLARIAEPLPTPRKTLWVQLIGGPLLGWVSRYHDDPDDRSTWVGINTCESAYWNQGLGTEALRLWLGYLFANLKWQEASSCPTQVGLRRIRMGTWSGNGRMVRCAEKCGLRLVSRSVGLRQVRGRRYDGLEFELLWQETSSCPTGESRRPG